MLFVLHLELSPNREGTQVKTENNDIFCTQQTGELSAILSQCTGPTTCLIYKHKINDLIIQTSITFTSLVLFISNFCHSYHSTFIQTYYKGWIALFKDQLRQNLLKIMLGFQLSYTLRKPCREVAFHPVREDSVNSWKISQITGSIREFHWPQKEVSRFFVCVFVYYFQD